MNKLQKRIATAIASGAMLLYTSIPTFAMTLEITGNGPDSNNTTNVSVTNSTYVSQSNNANVDNHVDATATTGDNSVEKSTGGDVSVKTGDASTDVTVTNSVNSNQASVPDCGTCATNADVTISGNGPDTSNQVNLDVNSGINSGTALFQDNHANVDNKVDANASSGGNEVDKATGGDVSVDTGDATTTVNVSTAANANSAVVGSGSGEGSNSVSLKILGNGPDTNNQINLGLDGSVYLSQDNNAHVDNNIDASSKTGKNEVDEATGGTASIKTGDATTSVTADNMVNFNWADVNCDGCLWDVTGKIAGNGPDTKNMIKADLGNDLAVFQDNCGSQEIGFPFDIFGGRFGGDHKCGVDNHVDAFAGSGANSMDEVTGGVLSGDPSVDSGDASSTVTTGTSGNANVYGSAPSWDFQMPYGYNLNISLDLSQLLAFLHLS